MDSSKSNIIFVWPVAFRHISELVFVKEGIFNSRQTDTNTRLCAALSPPRLPPLYCSQGAANISLICKLSNRILAKDHPGDSCVRGVKGSFLEVKGHLTQIYYLSPKGARRILGIGRKSATPPLRFPYSSSLSTHSLTAALIGVIVTA